MTDLSRSTLVKQLVNYKADDLINPSSKGPLPNALTEKMGNIALDIQVVDDARKKFKNQKKSNGKKGTNNSKYKLEKITTPISPIASDSGSRIIPVTSTLGSIKMHRYRRNTDKGWLNLILPYKHPISTPYFRVLRPRSILREPFPHQCDQFRQVSKRTTFPGLTRKLFKTVLTMVSHSYPDYRFENHYRTYILINQLSDRPLDLYRKHRVNPKV